MHQPPTELSNQQLESLKIAIDGFLKALQDAQQYLQNLGDAAEILFKDSSDKCQKLIKTVTELSKDNFSKKMLASESQKLIESLNKDDWNEFNEVYLQIIAIESIVKPNAKTQNSSYQTLIPSLKSTSSGNQEKKNLKRGSTHDENNENEAEKKKIKFNDADNIKYEDIFGLDPDDFEDDSESDSEDDAQEDTLLKNLLGKLSFIFRHLPDVVARSKTDLTQMVYQLTYAAVKGNLSHEDSFLTTMKEKKIHKEITRSLGKIILHLQTHQTMTISNEVKTKINALAELMPDADISPNAETEEKQKFLDFFNEIRADGSLKTFSGALEDLQKAVTEDNDVLNFFPELLPTINDIIDMLKESDMPSTYIMYIFKEVSESLKESKSTISDKCADVDKLYEALNSRFDTFYNYTVNNLDDSNNIGTQFS